MNPRIVFVALGCALILSAGFTWRARGQRQAAESVVAEAVRRQAATIATIGQGQSDLRLAGEKHAEFVKALDETLRANPAKPVTLATAATPRTPRPTVNLFETFAAHPEFHELYVKALRANIAARYGPFFATWGIAADRGEAVVAALARNAEMLSDVMTTAQAKKLSANDPAIQSLRGEADSTLSREITAALGDDGFTKFQDFRQSLPTRTSLNDLVVQLSSTDTPLTLRQTNELASLLQQQPLQSPQTREGSAPVDPARVEAVLNQSRTILGDPQFATFEMMVRSLQAQQTMAMLAKDAARKNMPAAKE